MSRAHHRLDKRRWARARRRAIERDGWRCTECGKAGRLEVHHVTPLWRNPEQDAYPLDGLATLCRRCHIAITRRERLERNSPSPAQARWDELVASLLADG
ncbi:MAG: HNH endonuclease [Actinomycetia bacterium]|nr:HNH endonuclease [Actinomycetes bacterium]